MTGNARLSDRARTCIPKVVKSCSQKVPNPHRHGVCIRRVRAWFPFDGNGDRLPVHLRPVPSVDLQLLAVAYNAIFPVVISAIIRQKPSIDQSGCSKVAG